MIELAIFAALPVRCALRGRDHFARQAEGGSECLTGAPSAAQATEFCFG